MWEEKDSLHRDQSIGGQAQASNLLGGQERGGKGLRGRQCGKRGRSSPEIRALEGRLRIQPAWGTGEGRAGAEGQSMWELPTLCESKSLTRGQSCGGQALASNLLGGQHRGR